MKTFTKKPTTRQKLSEQSKKILISPKNTFYNAQGEIAVWRAVIMQALLDASSNSQKREDKFAKAQAIAWLSGKSPDFSIVCSYANLSPEYVFRKAKEAILIGRNKNKKIAKMEINNTTPAAETILQICNKKIA